MSARSFKSVGWVAGVAAAALGCYMLSLQVAAERAELASVERRIVAARQAIRNLQTELGTRGRLQQLEHWNAEVLSLSAPVAGQFVENEVVLARLETRNRGIEDAEVRMASADAPSPPSVRQAVAAPAERAPAATPPVVRRASLDSDAAPARPTVTRATTTARAEAPRAAARPAAPRAAAPPARSASLIDERTARELGETARTERRARPRREAAGDGDGTQAN